MPRGQKFIIDSSRTKYHFITLCGGEKKAATQSAIDLFQRQHNKKCTKGCNDVPLMSDCNSSTFTHVNTGKRTTEFKSSYVHH
eukprot:11152-Eustigmatos_ZCMA.PRE.1